MEEALGLIILAISISQGKCQEESDEDEAWMDLVMVCFVVMARHLWHVEADLRVAEDDPEEQQSQED